MELKTDVGFSVLLHKGKWGTWRGGGGGGRDCAKGPSAAPGLSSLEGVWTRNSTSLHSENELLTENRWGGPRGGGGGTEGGATGKAWYGRWEQERQRGCIRIPAQRKKSARGGDGTETCLEHPAPPADSMCLAVAPLRRRTSDIKMLQEQGSSSQIFFFFFLFFCLGNISSKQTTCFLQMPVVLINQTRWSQHSPHVTFHQGFVWAEACQGVSAVGEEAAGGVHSLDNNAS